MLSLDKKLDKFMNSYSGEELTPKHFCKCIKIAMGTFYNNRAKIEERGINFVHGSKGVSTRQLTIVTSKNLNTVRFTISLYRLVINHLNLMASIQVPYLDVNDKLFKVEGKLASKEARKFIENALTREELNQQDRLNGSLLLVDLVHHVDSKIPNEVSLQISESFKTLYNISPEKEQIDVVYMMYRALTKDTYPNSFVQALAGTSKTTCVNVLKHFMKEYHQLDVKTTSYTQLASKELIGGSTLHSLLKKYLKIDVVNTTDDEILVTAHTYQILNKKKPVKMLVIDECTTLTYQILMAASALADKIVFIGDKNQFKNNTSLLGPRIGSLSTQYRFLNSESSLQMEITQAMLRRDTKKIKELLESVSVGTFEAKVRTRRTSTGTENYTDYSSSFTGHVDTLKEFSGKDSIIVAYSKDACNNINKILSGGEIKAGDKVVLTKTVYKPSLLPGGVFGKVVSVKGDTVKVLFEKGLFEVNFDDISLGYAVTSIKSQGSAWNNVLYVEGTAPKANKLEDTYVCPTRAKIRVRTLSRTTVNTKELGVQSIHNMEEGTRNINLYKALSSANEIALESGLESKEIVQVATSAFNIKNNTSSTCSKKETVKLHSEKNNTEVKPSNANWGYQLEGSHPYASQMNKTKEEAQYLLDMRLKANTKATGFITRNLEGTNLVVIDCDKKEAVEVFKDYLDKTEVYLSEAGDKAHYVFTTTESFNTKHYHKYGLDFLGNSKYTRQNIKPNKVSNGLSPIKLTDEVLSLLNNYVNN